MGGVTIPEDIEAAALAAWTSVPTADWEANAVDIIARAILAERQRCADRADKWAKDDLQSGEVRLAAAYIRREIMSGEK